MLYQDAHLVDVGHSETYLFLELLDTAEVLRFGVFTQLLGSVSIG